MGGGQRDATFEVIVRALAPYLGENMARASVRGHCERLRIVPGAITADQLDALVQALEPGLAVFVGREKTKGVCSGLRAQLAKGPGST